VEVESCVSRKHGWPGYQSMQNTIAKAKKVIKGIFGGSAAPVAQAA